MTEIDQLLELLRRASAMSNREGGVPIYLAQNPSGQWISSSAMFATDAQLEVTGESVRAVCETCEERRAEVAGRMV